MPASKGLPSHSTIQNSRYGLNPAVDDPAKSIDNALERFSREKAKQKMTPRINKWSQSTGLIPSGFQFRKLAKRWGSCTNSNEIILNYDAIKLPFTIIDYIIVHELAHIKHKDHSKDFYREVAKYIPDWNLLDEKLYGMKL